jgi:hypothetical protein
VKVETLLAALKTCRSAVKQRGIYPVFSCYCFADDIVFGYDDVVAILAKCQTGLVAAVRGDLLLGTVETFRGEIALEAKEDGHVVIKSGKSTVKVPSMGPDTFLFEPPEDLGSKLELEVSSDFFAGLTKCAATVGDDAQHREFTAVCLSYADKRFTLYSSDDIRLSVFEATEAVKVHKAAKGLKQSWLLSADACQTIVDAVNSVRDSLTAEQPVTMSFGDEMGSLTAGEQLLVYFRWLDATPPKYAETVARVSPDSAVWVPLSEELRAVVRRAEVLTGKDVASALDIELNGAVCKVALNADRGTRLGELSTAFSFSSKASTGPLKLSVSVSKLSGIIEAPKVSFSEAGVGFVDGAYTCWVSPLGE